MARYPAETFSLKDGRELTLRSLTADDAPAFPVFQQQVASESNYTLQRVGVAPSVETCRANLEKAEKDSVELRLGVFDGTRLVGMLGLHRELDHPWLAHSMRFGMMVVRDLWGAGVAAKLLQAAEGYLRTKGIRRWEATVRAANARGVSFYKRHGFVVEGTRRVAAVIDGVDHDELYIAKLLS